MQSHQGKTLSKSEGSNSNFGFVGFRGDTATRATQAEPELRNDKHAKLC